MNNYYDDILSLTDSAPIWFDEHAVPRYCEFSPQRISNIYAKDCVLFLIECQSCEHEFTVARSQDNYHLATLAISPSGRRRTLKEMIENGSLSYGDPPNVNCCAAGPTMGATTKKILQYWSRDNLIWRRRPELEISLEEDQC